MGNYSNPVWKILPTGPDGLPGVAHVYSNKIPLMGRYFFRFISHVILKKNLLNILKNNQFCIK